MRITEPDNAAASAPIYDEVAQKIANVLRAAEENSVELLAAARADAQAIRGSAEREAHEARAQLAAEVAKRRSESELIRAEANRYAEERRLTAEREAQQTQAEAEADVRSLRESGQELRQHFREVSELIERLLGEFEPDVDEQLLTEVQETERALRSLGDPLGGVMVPAGDEKSHRARDRARAPNAR